MKSALLTNLSKPFSKNSRLRSSDNLQIFNVMLFTKSHAKTVLGTTLEKLEDAFKPEKRNINEI